MRGVGEQRVRDRHALNPRQSFVQDFIAWDRLVVQAQIEQTHNRAQIVLDAMTQFAEQRGFDLGLVFRLGIQARVFQGHRNLVREGFHSRAITRVKSIDAARLYIQNAQDPVAHFKWDAHLRPGSGRATCREIETRIVLRIIRGNGHARSRGFPDQANRQGLTIILCKDILIFIRNSAQASFVGTFVHGQRRNQVITEPFSNQNDHFVQQLVGIENRRDPFGNRADDGELRRALALGREKLSFFNGGRKLARERLHRRHVRRFENVRDRALDVEGPERFTAGFQREHHFGPADILVRVIGVIARIAPHIVRDNRLTGPRGLTD